MVLLKIIVLSIFAMFTPSMCLTNASDSLCHPKSEIVLSDRGVESSLSLDLLPNSTVHTCRREFKAPDSYSFYVRLQRIFREHPIDNNATCGLVISQSLKGEILPPWRIDPCAESQIFEEPCRLLQGKLSIAWTHNRNVPSYRIIITAIGNANHCLDKDKFTCLELDSVPLLCIDRNLTCDGIRHCPIKVNGVSDEDPALCTENHPDPQESAIQSMLKKIQVIKSFFAHEATSTTTRPIVKTRVIDIDKHVDVYEKDVTHATEKKSHKGALTGLSKYGPWGYLFLGMLLCGGALLVCGLWECCCRSNKPDPIDTLNGDIPAVFLETSPNEANTSSNTVRYEELDPPPAYSALFPNQKPPMISEEVQCDIENEDEQIHSIQTQTE